MKFASVIIALVATATAEEVVGPSGNPGRDRIVGETCVKTEDRCVNNVTDKVESANLKCCNLRITLLSTSKDQLVCVNTELKDVTISDGTGLTYGYNCDYEGGALYMAVSSTVAALSALYILA